ncbi:MAG: DUF3311 domain-containing protein [Nannocystaceae bacterium]|nr:DUF3311 domain-containing protein [Deltaproteobacteria bacterium]MBP7288767.1 DUF3311 domain-containing protein [Nannocystaceae bacterium]
MAAVAALVVLHLVPARGGPSPLLFGTLPWTLAWSLAWMLAAAVVVWAMTSRTVWPDDEDRDDDDRDDADRERGPRA